VQVRNRSGADGNAGNITGIILAAGESKRMGKPKMLLPFGESTILETVIASARDTQLHNVRVVLGSGREEIEKKIHDPGIRIVSNPDYKKGMLSSVQCGLREIGPGISAVMILLGDQPMIGKAVIERMIKAYRTTEKSILVATFNGKRGHPLLFHASYIPEILAFPSGSSLKSLLTKHSGQVQEVETGEPGILRDIDTEKEYQKELKYQKNND
jgi:molybdenum cofactor cytidylyltransferase